MAKFNTREKSPAVKNQLSQWIFLDIKKGVYCNWCAELMKKTLIEHFAIKEINIDVIGEKAHINTSKRIKPESIIVYLKKRGYYLIEDGKN